MLENKTMRSKLTLLVSPPPKIPADSGAYVQTSMATTGRFDVLSLQEQCEELQLLDHENVVEVLNFAKDFYFRRLERKTMRFILVHFMEVVKHSANFQKLTAMQLEAFFDDDELNVRHEDETCKVNPADLSRRDQVLCTGEWSGTTRTWTPGSGQSHSMAQGVGAVPACCRADRTRRYTFYGRKDKAPKSVVE